MSLSDRLGKLENHLTPECIGPPLTIEHGDAANAAPAPAFCPLCGRPVREHQVPFGIVFVDVPSGWYEGRT